jgi:hypothetical protein
MNEKVALAGKFAVDLGENWGPHFNHEPFYPVVYFLEFRVGLSQMLNLTNDSFCCFI